VVRRARGAVVNIHSERTAGGTRTDEFFSLQPSQHRVNGMGTGIVLDPRGFLVTNQHVVEDVHSLRVRLHDGSTYTARVLCRDPESDLALLKIEPRSPLPTLPLGTSSDLMVGETVIAIGNAYGYEHTVTAGVVSATARDVTLNKDISYKALIQTDAAINPGNSGGPLLNVKGELVGVNVAIRAGAQGIGFAIPADTVVRVAAGLLAQSGSIPRGSERELRAPRAAPRASGARTALGLTVRDEVLPEGQGGADGLPAAGPGRRRLVVEAVEPDSPALRAGIRKGDVLAQAGDVPCASSVDLERALLDGQGNALPGGEHLPLRVRRDGTDLRVEAVLDARERIEQPARAEIATSPADGSPGRGAADLPARLTAAADAAWRRLGLRVVGVGADSVSHSHPQLRGGLMVVEVREGSTADRAGIQRGDVLVGLHQWEMLSLDNVLYVLNHPDLASFQPLRFFILRAGQVHRGWLQAE
jgi:serine protease Do